jgi:hypothetical protein
MKKILTKTLLVLSLTLTNAFAENWTVLDANLKIENFTPTKKACHFCKPVDDEPVLEEKNANVKTLIKADGVVTIVEYEEETMATRTITIPVQVRMLSRGLNLQHAQSNGKMSLRFLSGSKVSDIFGKYYGAELDVAIFGRAGLKTFVNKKGIVVTDFIASGGFGAKLAGTTFGIFAESRQDIRIDTKTDTGVKIDVRNLTLGELNDHKFN